MKLISPITVALVDDYFPIRKTLGAFLTDHGFIISHQAGNGKEFLDELEKGGPVPDMCLLDVNMPIMDGYETAIRLRNQYPEILILGFSFYDDKERIEKILKCGVHGFISKDKTTEEIRDALVELMLNSYSKTPVAQPVLQ